MICIFTTQSVKPTDTPTVTPTLTPIVTPTPGVRTNVTLTSKGGTATATLFLANRIPIIPDEIKAQIGINIANDNNDFRYIYAFSGYDISRIQISFTSDRQAS